MAWLMLTCFAIEPAPFSGPYSNVATAAHKTTCCFSFIKFAPIVFLIYHIRESTPFICKHEFLTSTVL